MARIPQPKHQHGATVQVLNYRKRPAVWEAGTITRVSITNGFGGGFSVSYTVRLVRRYPVNRRGNERPIDCHVGEESVRRG